MNQSGSLAKCVNYFAKIILNHGNKTLSNLKLRRHQEFFLSFHLFFSSKPDLYSEGQSIGPTGANAPLRYGIKKCPDIELPPIPIDQSPY